MAEHYGIDLHSEQMETIGGYLTEFAGRIPSQGEVFTIHAKKFTIREANAKHVESILVETLGDE